jgi:hypothetical protein
VLILGGGMAGISAALARRHGFRIHIGGAERQVGGNALRLNALTTGAPSRRTRSGPVEAVVEPSEHHGCLTRRPNGSSDTSGISRPSRQGEERGSVKHGA